MDSSSVTLAPSVQDLEKQGITKVPKQYLQPNQDSILGSKQHLYRNSQLSTLVNFFLVAKIDLSKLLCEDAIELENLDHACKHWGFF